MKRGNLMGLMEFIKNSIISSQKSEDASTIKNTKPNMLRQDYGITLMLSAYGKGQPIMTGYPVYFERECGVTNPRILHENLVKDGYLGPAAHEDILTNYKIPELKEILTEIGATKTGKKQELITRILENSGPDTLERILGPQKCYSLTPLGEEFLNAHKDYVELHKSANWMIPIDEYKRAKRTLHSENFFEVAEKILKDRIRTADCDAGICLAGSSLADLYKKMGDFQESLYYLLLVVYIEVNSLSYYPPYDLYKRGIISKKDLKEGYQIKPFYPGMITRIAKLNDYYSESLVEKIYKTKIVAAVFCDKKCFTNIVDDIFNESSFPFEKWNEYFKNKFYRYAGI